MLLFLSVKSDPLRNEQVRTKENANTCENMQQNEADKTEGTQMGTTASGHYETTWGPWLFRLTLAVTLFFMWWLVIYDHGVVTHH